MGEPYISFPVGAFRFGHGGVMGFGTICGTMLGAGITIGLVAGKEPGERMILDVINWYSDTELPIYKPERLHPKGAEIKNITKSDTPLCHMSVGRWMKKEGVHFDDPRRKDRCARLSADQVALKYKELWQVEQVFREVKSILETRPIYHQRDENIRGHVFCSFLALVVTKKLIRRVDFKAEWDEIRQDLKSLEEVVIEENGKSLALRTECLGTCSKVFQAVGVAIPPTIREV